MKKKRIIGFALSALMGLSVLTSMPGSYAGESDTTQATQTAETSKTTETNTSSTTIDGLRNDLSNAKKDLEQAQGAYDSAVKELKALEAEIAVLQAQINQKGEEIAFTQGQIDENDAFLVELRLQIQQLDREIYDQNSALNKRLRVMYETGDKGILAVLLGSESFVDFLSNLEMVRRIHESDKVFLMELEVKLDDFEKKRDLAIEIEAKLVAQRAVLQEQKNLLDADKAELATVQQRVQTIRDAAAAEIKRLEQESKRIEQELVKMTTQWGDYGGGAIGWPANGPVTSEYGGRIHPITGRWTVHNGIDLGVATGTPVHAGADGIVYFSGWNSGGYGNLVMIDHGVDANGNTIVTMYAHNSSVAVGVGTVVSRGQVIAYAGSTGNSTGPHIHMEVRVNGTPVNPRGYLG